jgi:hypothetical protein
MGRSLCLDSLDGIADTEDLITRPKALQQVIQFGCKNRRDAGPGRSVNLLKKKKSSATT